MADEQAVERLRIRPQSIVAAVAATVALLVLLRIFVSAQKVIAWVVTAGIIAGLVRPVINWLDIYIPRGLAVLIVALLAIGTIGATIYGVVDNVKKETAVLLEEAPKLAARLEESGRFAEAARNAHLADKTREFVSEIPKKLIGETSVKSFGDLALTMSLIMILGVFLTFQGPKLLRSLLGQIREPNQRDRAERVLKRSLIRAFSWLRRTLLMAGVAGGLAFALAVWAGLPASLPLALWVALWNPLPFLGVLIGAGPLVGVAFITNSTWGWILLSLFVTLQLAEAVVRHYWVERAVRVGPFVTIIAFVIGFNLRRVSGIVFGLLLAAFLVALATETAPRKTRLDLA